MHAFSYFALSIIGVAYSLPTLLAESKRGLIKVSPDLDLGLDVNNDNSCLGLGISVCDPITVDSNKTSTVTKGSSSSSSSSSISPPSSTPTAKEASSSGDDPLIDISPDLGLDLGLSNENSCLGIGISACDPITVGSDVTNTVDKGDNDADTSSNPDSPSKENTQQSSYPTSTTSTSASTYPTTTSKSTPTSTPTQITSAGSKSTGGGLLDLSPVLSPDVNLNNDNSCQGIGISACDPITVDSNVNNTVSN
ncbi:uncharacterized protein GGS25DRAFT_505449 [Hypoxylon fragiforme]|uniref:uncharacterized protein n=1 Tax=Hypoxylon fragiforme TaxID=63214 RepID=UPI0020C6B574|nr:uncharacterized protein GGS25DRAFT_505449 [Hypoxylon fragiforme]KAI2603789.1 hypothetical protein GGS25DRAFT_505449 [Hypoxylon fragiforme]